MAANSVTNVYLHVMDDVIANMTPDFQNEGVNESVLDELKAVNFSTTPLCPGIVVVVDF